LNEEEESFARTLYRGEALFDKYAAKAAAENNKSLNGIDVWRLYDTFGFPGDLTRIMAEERGLVVDEAAFEKAKQESYEISKAGGKSKGKDSVKLDVHDLGALEKNDAVPKTDDSAKFREFPSPIVEVKAVWLIVSNLVLGNTNGMIKGIYQSSQFVSSTTELPASGSFGILLDKTNFYAEAGGQIYDTGVIGIDGEAEFEVTDVQMFNGYVLHIGHMKEGDLKIGDEVICTYDEVSFGRLLVLPRV
jgi:alanyl-tRNA synthetase